MAGNASNASQDAGQPAFDGHYEQWGESVYRYLVHLVRSPTMAEDLFQETWMKAFEHQGELRDPARFRPWILRIARNLAFNHLRQRHNKLQVWAVSDLAGPSDADEAEGLLERQPNADPDPRERAIGGQRREIVAEAMTELDQTTQEMLQLRYYEECTLPEIAELLRVPLGTVCTKVHRGLKAIRERLKRQGLRGLEDV